MIAVVPDRVVWRVTPAADGVGWEPRLREDFAFAGSALRNDPADFCAGADLIDKRGLDVIFASEAVGIERDFVIQTAPLAEIDGVSKRDVEHVNIRALSSH